IMTPIIAIALLAGQSMFPSATFEFGEYRDYSGRIESRPYPKLLTPEGQYLLAGGGKHGVAELFPQTGPTVRVRGSLIARENVSMLEIVPASLEIFPGANVHSSDPIPVGPVRLTGEIVDSKCYL